MRLLLCLSAVILMLTGGLVSAASAQEEPPAAEGDAGAAEEGSTEEGEAGDDTASGDSSDDPAGEDQPTSEETEEPAEATPSEETPAEEPAADATTEEEPAPSDEPMPADEGDPADEPATEPAPEEEPGIEPVEDAPADPAEAETAPVEEAEVKVVLSGLNNPSSVAIQPETGRVFVADSGAGRVVSFNPADNEPVKADITGFPLDEYGKGPIYKIGPLGLAFLDQNMLVVGDGSLKDGQELVRFYDLSQGGTLAADDAKFQRGPIAPGEQSTLGEGNFYAVAASNTDIYFTSNGDDTKGWVLRIQRGEEEPGELTPFIATKVATEPEPVDAPVGIVLNQDGQIVIGQMGEINVPADSLYTVYDPQSGELLARASTGLNDIAGLAYSPSGKLYAVDFSWMDPTAGGLFRLDVNQDDLTVQSVKIASLDKPTALTFGPDGTLYVTLFGTAEEGSTKKPGKLVKVLGEF